MEQACQQADHAYNLFRFLNAIETLMEDIANIGVMVREVDRKLGCTSFVMSIACRLYSGMNTIWLGVARRGTFCIGQGVSSRNLGGNSAMIRPAASPCADAVINPFSVQHTLVSAFMHEQHENADHSACIGCISQQATMLALSFSTRHIMLCKQPVDNCSC